uniref:INO80 complex subunit E n=1 Tax=Parastrongyloides trichosuri TaxID=131310 RepID=A0A0N4Z588_PARTI
MGDSNRSGSMSNQSSSTPLPSPSTLLQNSSINNIHQSINGRNNNYGERQPPQSQQPSQPQHQTYVIQSHPSSYNNSNIQNRPPQRIVTSHNPPQNNSHHQTVVIQQRTAPQQNPPYIRTQQMQARVVAQQPPQHVQEVQSSQNGEEQFGNVVVSQFRGSSLGNYSVAHKSNAPKSHNMPQGQQQIPQQQQPQQQQQQSQSQISQQQGQSLSLHDSSKNGSSIESENQQLTAKEQYRELKRNFKFLVYENECYQDELRSLQRKLLKLSRDKNFLLDRLTQYEKLSESSDDSDTSVKTIEDKSSKVKTKKRVRTTAASKKKTSVSSNNVNVVPQETNTTTAKSSVTESTPVTPSVKTSPLKAKVEVAPLSSQALLKSASITQQQRHPKSAPTPQHPTQQQSSKQQNIVSHHHHDSGSHVMIDSSPLTSPNGKIHPNDIMISPNSGEYMIVNSIPDQHMEDRIVYEDMHHGQMLEYVDNDQYDNGDVYYMDNHSNL